MECPYCDHETILIKERKEVEFKGEKYLITETYFHCESCGQDFTTTELDEENINQVYNQYRAEKRILFPEEIIELRNLFGLSRRKMSLLLGWGENTYSLYEKGAIPNESHSNLLKLIKRNPTQLLEIAETKRDLITDRELAGLKLKIGEHPKSSSLAQVSFNLTNDIIDEFSGYIRSNIEKLANSIIYFLNKNINYTVRLNKMLFYSDFLCYKNFKKPITGWNYAAIPMGPVINRYKIVFPYLEEVGYIKTEEGFVNNEGELIEKTVANKEFEIEKFENYEIQIMDFILDRFKKMTTPELVDFSHKERAWIENFSAKGLISYQKYADDLQIDLLAPYWKTGQ